MGYSLTDVEPLTHASKRRQRFYTCPCCQSHEIMSRATKDNPHQACTTCFIISDPKKEDTFLAWSDYSGRPVEEKP